MNAEIFQSSIRWRGDLVLFAMQTSNVSYVVAVREVSIVFSALFGIIWLGEGHRQPRLIGAFLIALGVSFIGLSR